MPVTRAGMRSKRDVAPARLNGIDEEDAGVPAYMSKLLNEYPRLQSTTCTFTNNAFSGSRREHRVDQEL